MVHRYNNLIDVRLKQVLCIYKILGYLIPKPAVEAEVDMEVLVVVVVEDGVRLPGLPPVRFEVDARVVDDAVVVRVHRDHRVRNCQHDREKNTNYSHLAQSMELPI